MQSDRVISSFQPNNMYKCGIFLLSCIPKLERVLDRSIKAFFPGLLRTDRFAREMSAVTRVIVILKQRERNLDSDTYQFNCGFPCHT